MSKQHDQDHSAEGSGLSPFEQQLRSVTPAPPQTEWQEIAQLLKPQSKVTTSAPQVSGWQRIATHAAATLIGVGLGAVLMVMLQPATTTPAAATSVDVEVTQQIAAEPERSKSDQAASNQIVRQQEFENDRYLMPPMNRNQTMRWWTLTPLVRDINSRPWGRISYEQQPTVDEDSSATPMPAVPDKPMSAPELLRQMLKDQAHRRPCRGSGSDTQKAMCG